MAKRTVFSRLQLWFVASAWLVILIDQLSKQIAIQNLTIRESVPFLGDVVKFFLVFNDSAAFSIGGGVTWIFTIFSTVASLALIWYSRSLETKSWMILGGVALGGIVGNLIDRITRAPGFAVGRVVDFIQIPFNFPIFNLADSAIVVVAGIVIIRLARGEQLGKAKK